MYGHPTLLSLSIKDILILKVSLEQNSPHSITLNLNLRAPKKLKPKKNPQNSERNLRTLFKNQENLENLKKEY